MPRAPGTRQPVLQNCWAFLVRQLCVGFIHYCCGWVRWGWARDVCVQVVGSDSYVLCCPHVWPTHPLSLHRHLFVQETLQNEWLRRAQLLQRVACLPPLSQEAAEELLPPGSPSSSPALACFLREHVGVEHGTDVVALATAAEPALHGSAAHRVRAALIALLGWTAEPLGGAPGSGEGAEASPQYLLPERCLLRCALCGATVGLWSCFPELVRSADAGTSPVASPRPTGAPAGARGVLSPTVTIAGGALAASARDGARAVQGPFGLRGRQSPSFGSPGQDRAGGEPPAQRSMLATSIPHPQAPPCTIAGGRLDADAGAGPRPAQSFKGSAAPFGFASLEAQMSRRGPRRAAGAACGKRGHEEAEGATANDLPIAASPKAPGREPTASPRLALPVAVDDASGWYLSSSALERYARLSVRPLDVVSLHRSFCPWTATSQGRPGWEQVLEQLAPEGASNPQTTSKKCAPAQPAAAEWNPVTLLNSVLGKVDVQL